MRELQRGEGHWALSPQEKEEASAMLLVSISIIRKRLSFQSGYKNSKNLFILNTSRERVVSNKVIHRNKRRGWFVRA